MKRKIITLAAAAGILLACAQALRAEPMKCSGEQKNCAADCAKYTNKTVAAKCVQSCFVSQSICLRTGCWDSGNGRYCGLMKQ